MGSILSSPLSTVCMDDLAEVGDDTCEIIHAHETIYHVMPREKRCGALDSCFGLVGPHQQSIPHNFSLWYHEFIKAKLSAALVVLN